MGYYIDLFEITLKDFSERLKRTELLPSQRILGENMEAVFQIFEENGIRNIGELQQALKTKTKAAAFSEKTAIDIKYLTVLLREINSLHPEPRKISDFPYVSNTIKDKLLSIGVKTTFDLFEKIKNEETRAALQCELDCSAEEVLYLAQLVDVSRLRYVNQTFATLLVACGYNSIEKVKEANYERLYESIIGYNQQNALYKGNIGLKDMKYLIESVPDNMECII